MKGYIIPIDCGNKSVGKAKECEDKNKPQDHLFFESEDEAILYWKTERFNFIGKENIRSFSKHENDYYYGIIMVISNDKGFSAIPITSDDVSLLNIEYHKYKDEFIKSYEICPPYNFSLIVAKKEFNSLLDFTNFAVKKVLDGLKSLN